MATSKKLQPSGAPRTGFVADERSTAITELLSYRLHQVANLVSRSASMRYKREFDVQLWEWRTIALLGARQMLSLKDLAKVAGLDKGQISRVAAGLIERRLVLREVDEVDGRKIRLTLTAPGKRLYEGLTRVSSARNAELLACLTADEQYILKGILDKLEHKAREFIQYEKEAGK